MISCNTVHMPSSLLSQPYILFTVCQRAECHVWSSYCQTIPRNPANGDEAGVNQARTSRLRAQSSLEFCASSQPQCGSRLFFPFLVMTLPICMSHFTFAEHLLIANVLEECLWQEGATGLLLGESSRRQIDSQSMSRLCQKAP